VPEIVAEPVELPYDDGVARPQRSYACGELRPVVLAAGCMVFVDTRLVDACGVGR